MKRKVYMRKELLNESGVGSVEYVLALSLMLGVFLFAAEYLLEASKVRASVAVHASDQGIACLAAINRLSGDECL